MSLTLYILILLDEILWKNILHEVIQSLFFNSRFGPITKVNLFQLYYSFYQHPDKSSLWRIFLIG